MKEPTNVIHRDFLDQQPVFSGLATLRLEIKKWQQQGFSLLQSYWRDFAASVIIGSILLPMIYLFFSQLASYGW